MGPGQERRHRLPWPIRPVIGGSNGNVEEADGLSMNVDEFLARNGIHFQNTDTLLEDKLRDFVMQEGEAFAQGWIRTDQLNRKWGQNLVDPDFGKTHAEIIKFFSELRDQKILVPSKVSLQHVFAKRTVQIYDTAQLLAFVAMLHLKGKKEYSELDNIALAKKTQELLGEGPIADAINIPGETNGLKQDFAPEPDSEEVFSPLDISKLIGHRLEAFEIELMQHVEEGATIRDAALIIAKAFGIDVLKVKVWIDSFRTQRIIEGRLKKIYRKELIVLDRDELVIAAAFILVHELREQSDRYSREGIWVGIKEDLQEAFPEKPWAGKIRDPIK